MQGLYSKYILDHFKGVFPNKTEAYLNTICYMNTAIKVAVIWFKHLRQNLSQTIVLAMLTHTVYTVFEEKNESQARP